MLFQMRHIIVLISLLLFIGLKGLAQKKICICLDENIKVKCANQLIKIFK